MQPATVVKLALMASYGNKSEGGIEKVFTVSHRWQFQNLASD